MQDRLEEIRIDEIYVDEDFNCREEISIISLQELSDSIKSRGLIQPIVVSEASEEEQKLYGKKYILIAGFRRTKACEMILQHEKIKAIVQNIPDPLDRRTINLLENLDRKELNILQEARAIEPYVRAGWSRKKICQALSRNDGWVQVRTYLLGMPPEIQKDAGAGVLTQNNIRELYTVQCMDKNPETLYAFVRDLKSKKERGMKGVSINPYIKKVSEKHKPSPNELRDLMNHFYDSRIGPGIWTKCIAYALGEITLIDVYDALEEYAQENDIVYYRPLQKLEGEEDSNESNDSNDEEE